MVQSIFAIPDFFTFLQLVKDHEQDDEFAIDINRRSIWFGPSTRGNNDWSDQAAISLHRLIDMAVIKPEPGAFSGRRTAVGISEPVVSEVAAGRHRNAGQIIRINGAFILFVIAQAVHMNAVVASRKIAKMYHHRVAYFRPDDGTKNPEPFGLRLALSKSAVGVFGKPCLFPAPVKAPWIRNVFSVHQFQSTWSVVPLNLFCGNVIFTHMTLGFGPLLSHGNGSTGQEKEGHQENCACFSFLSHGEWRFADMGIP